MKSLVEFDNEIPYKTVNTLGFNVYSDDLSKISLAQDIPKVINTISPNSYGLSKKDVRFRESLIQSDFLVLDGVYFALASILLNGRNIKKNQGPFLFEHFMSRLNKQGGKSFFLGSTPRTLKGIKKNAAKKFPNIKVESCSPPFKAEFTPEEDDAMLNQINQFKPDILFIGMTCPKQENWAIRNKDKINASLIISIGNVFDWFGGTQKSIHPFWYRVRLGWLVRIILRPEIFRRNIRNQMKFFADTFKEFFLKVMKTFSPADR